MKKAKPDPEEARSPNEKIVRRRDKLENRILEINGEMEPFERRLRKTERALKDLQLACKHPNMTCHGAVSNCPDCHFRAMRA